MNKLSIEYRSIDDLIPYAMNSRTHSAEQVAQVAASIRAFGWTNPVLIDEDGSIIAGHGRTLAARQLGMAEVPTITLAGLTENQRRAYVIADNKLALNAGWDEELLALEIAGLAAEGFDMDLLGFDDAELAELLKDAGGGEGAGDDKKGDTKTLADRFMIPPFTVLNAREGWWQNRKRAWLALGIQSEKGRGEDGVHARTFGQDLMKGEGKGVLMTSLSGRVPDYYKQKTAAEKTHGKMTSEEFEENHLKLPETGGLAASGTSVFDPVLCEIAYRWFSPEGGTILDPFAGGSVRGVVASKLGRQYIGHELRQEQVDANRAQGSDLCGDDAKPPAWICGDSRNIDTTCADVDADMVFSCPPYADLEVYSDDARDLSTMGYADFLKIYREIIAKACARLRPDRFACFVVGDVRDKKGNYYNFVGDTVQAFKDAGLHYYNEAILVTSVGSLPIRAAKQFSAGRKLGKTHQNILVFVKGDGKKATAACGTIEIGDDVLAAYADAGEP